LGVRAADGAGVAALTLLTDTHIWYRWRADPRKLTRAQLCALRTAERRNEPVGVSAIGLWELAMLAASGRIRVTQPLASWIEEMADHPLLETLPITPAIAAASVGLVGLHGDPADRLIVSTALGHDLTLLTADERIREWGGVRVL